MSLLATSPRHRSAADRQLRRHDDPRRAAVAGARVRSRRRHPVRAQHRGAGAGRRAVARRPGAGRRSCRSGSASIRKAAASRACKAPFTEWPPMATLGRSGDAALAARFARGAGRGAAGRSASRSTTRRSSTSTPTRRTRSSATARSPRTPTTVARLGAAIIRGAAGRRRRRVRQALSRARRHVASTRISSCRSSSIRRIASARVECVPFRAAIAAGVAFIMTAHVLVPSLDEERPATLSPRIVQRHAARRARASRA